MYIHVCSMHAMRKDRRTGVHRFRTCHLAYFGEASTPGSLHSRERTPKKTFCPKSVRLASQLRI